METVEAKLEVNVANLLTQPFHKRQAIVLQVQRLYLNLVWPSCDLFMPFDIRYSDKQRKTQREISDRLDELSRCYARHIVYIATTMDGKDRNFSVFFEV